MTQPLSARGTSVLRATLVGIAGLAIAAPAWVVTHPPAIVRTPRVRLPTARVVPRAEVPRVEPVTFVDLDPDDARAFNATVPFSTDPNPAARPFRFAGGAEDRARATDCMAAGVLYEAGDDAEGERAVAQVVLNRLRHPAFPKTVCGVVFEGQERATGCQFSFSCDGALRRWHPSDVAWRRAHEVASAALSGSVFKPVGYATHYHTDWVVPYWQSSLDKITAVHTHLFFRWSGWWGTPPAFRRQPDSTEPVIAQLAAISAAHRGGSDDAGDGADLKEAFAALGLAPDTGGVVAPPPTALDSDTVLTVLPRGQSPDAFPALAAQACGDKPFCRYLAWVDRSKVASSLPLSPAQIATLTFSYLRDRSSGYEKPLWNCQQNRRADPTQCMRVQMTMTANPVAPPAVIETVKPPELTGVRRKGTPPPLEAPARP